MCVALYCVKPIQVVTTFTCCGHMLARKTTSPCLSMPTTRPIMIVYTQWHSHRDTAVITFTFMLVLMLLCSLLSKVIELAKSVCKILQLFNCVAEYDYLFKKTIYSWLFLQGVSGGIVLLNTYFYTLCKSFTWRFGC